MACSMLSRNRALTASRPAAQRRVVVQAVQKPCQVQQAQQQQPTASSTAPQHQLASLLKPAAVTAVANIIMALPASAEAGKIFDFNLTLPVMAGQFLLLMVFLDKAWFTPVGKVLDERDSMIRDKLSSVKDNGGDVDRFAREAEEILKKARSEVSAMINSKKGAKQAELDKVYAEYKSKVQAEVDSSIAGLEKESAAVLKSLDAQVEKISAEVLKRVLPASVKI